MTEQVDPMAVDPQEFAAQLAKTPDEQIAAGMASEARGMVLDEIFKRMGDYLKPETAQGLDAVVHWKILERPDGGFDHYELVIKDGKATVTKEPQREPRVTFSVGAVDFLKLVSGNANGPILFTTGRLKISGDLVFAAQIAGMFRMPTGPAPAAGATPAA
jgi:putative sterol carrier protein